jgi:phospholipase C
MAKSKKAAVQRPGKAKPKKPEPIRFVSFTADDAQKNLAKIDHIVVLMMENRSFDHMLGYLTLEDGRTDVDGLTKGMANSLGNKTYHPRHLDETAFKKIQDPCHSGGCVADQLKGNNGGFVSNYAETHPQDKHPELVMGYYNGKDLPVYDYLVREFALCDRWHASVPGATWPNRLYSITGQSPSKDNPGGNKPPIYKLPSFVRHLTAGNIDWGWYTHFVSTLRLIDEKYRIAHNKHFFYFDKKSIFVHENFLTHASEGKLSAVSWIDPNFADFRDPTVASNDDHPPSNVTAGQELVLKLYNALVNSPSWKKTLLIITYDEHGGFFDHVTPPAAQDDNKDFRQYGLRVPAIIVSPWVERGAVSKTVFDHTSVIKTILLRFCQRADGTIPDMGARVTAANHLGSLLTATSPRPAPPPSSFDHLVSEVAHWKSEAFKNSITAQVEGLVSGVELNELQQSAVAAKLKLMELGLKEGQP